MADAVKEDMSPFRARAMIEMDFKEKVRDKPTASQLQRDYFGGTYISVLNITLHFRGSVHHFDFISSADTSQDTFWVSEAFE